MSVKLLSNMLNDLTNGFAKLITLYQYLVVVNLKIFVENAYSINVHFESIKGFFSLDLKAFESLATINPLLLVSSFEPTEIIKQNQPREDQIDPALHRSSFQLLDVSSNCWSSLPTGQEFTANTNGTIMMILSGAKPEASAQLSLYINDLWVCGCSVRNHIAMKVPTNSCSYPVYSGQRYRVELLSKGSVNSDISFLEIK